MVAKIIIRGYYIGCYEYFSSSEADSSSYYRVIGHLKQVLAHRDNKGLKCYSKVTGVVITRLEFNGKLIVQSDTMFHTPEELNEFLIKNNIQ